MAKLETSKFDKKHFFLASNFFMHMFTRSLVCMQNTEEIQLKLIEELITQIMHYQPVFIKCSFQKMSKFKTLSFCQTRGPVVL